MSANNDIDRVEVGSLTHLLRSPALGRFRIIRVFFSLFSVIIIACYTGNMAAIRSASTEIASISSVSECAEDPSCSLCIGGVIATAVKQR